MQLLAGPEMTSSERILERELVSKLQELKYSYREDIRDRATLEQNFREKFEALNRVRLTDSEFARLIDEIVTPDVFTAARTIRERNSFTRDDGTPLNYTLVDIKDWCKNAFEVVNLRHTGYPVSLPQSLPHRAAISACDPVCDSHRAPISTMQSTSLRPAPRDSKYSAITPQFAPSRSRYPVRSLQSAEVAIPKNDSRSVAYENRTKSVKCGGLETNGQRDRISGPDALPAVRRFAGEARGYWRFQRAKTRRRMLVAEGVAEREELGSNGLLVCNPEYC
jgi:hypothetical protein